MHEPFEVQRDVALSDLASVAADVTIAARAVMELTAEDSCDEDDSAVHDARRGAQYLVRLAAVVTTRMVDLADEAARQERCAK